MKSNSLFKVAAMALVFMLLSCDKQPPVPYIPTEGRNVLMSYKWVYTRHQVIDDENTIYNLVLYFTSDSTLQQTGRFRAPMEDYWFPWEYGTYVFDGSSGFIFGLLSGPRRFEYDSINGLINFWCDGDGGPEYDPYKYYKKGLSDDID